MEFNKEIIIAAIKEIDENPELRNKRHSSTYDLVFNGQKYPPILVLSVANKLNGENELTLEDFGNNVEIPFKILRDNGFEIIKKTKEMIPNIYDFIKVSEEQITGQGTTVSAKNYSKENKISKGVLKTEISFGVGRASAIPWIAFIGYGQTVKNGIYPVFLYYKAHKKLILAYGVSETNIPIYDWGVYKNKQTIRDYFEGKEKKYGESFIFKVYNTESLPSSQFLESDLNQILSEYKFLFENKKSVTKPIKSNFKEDFSVNQFQKSLILSGLVYSNRLTIRFTASLLTKPFVILTGLSGSGKTKLAQSFVQWICEDKSQYEIVPVGADWTNREPLLGYPNALEKEEYVSPENGVLDLMLRAKSEYENYLSNKRLIPKPYFLILDEMNLSHVERYFADFLSTMESGDIIPLHKIENDSLIVPQSIKLPKNLFIVGTVNIDETTYMFSPKVLDRANTIEFRLTEEDLLKFIASDIKLNMDVLEAQGANMSEGFMTMALKETDKNLKESEKDLKLFFSELKKSGAEFGYRTASEIGRLMHMLKELGESGDNLFDIAIMQKLLPKLHGSRNKLTKVLPILGGFCLTDNSKIKEDYLDKFVNNTITEEELNEDKNIKYPISFEKICRMYKNAVENGFASYAEA